MTPPCHPECIPESVGFASAASHRTSQREAATEDTAWLFQQVNYFQSHPEELAWKASRLKTSKRKIERLSQIEVGTPSFPQSWPSPGQGLVAPAAGVVQPPEK